MSMLHERARVIYDIFVKFFSVKCLGGLNYYESGLFAQSITVYAK